MRENYLREHINGREVVLSTSNAMSAEIHVNGVLVESLSGDSTGCEILERYEEIKRSR